MSEGEFEENSSLKIKKILLYISNPRIKHFQGRMFRNFYRSWGMEKLIYTLYSIQLSFSLHRMSEEEFKENSSLKIKEILLYIP